MTKGSNKSVNNLLRISGILFGITAAYHLLRYLMKDDLKIMNLTYFGSLLIGIVFALLSFSCFNNSRK
jgi:hypothetical protein